MTAFAVPSNSGISSPCPRPAKVTSRASNCFRAFSFRLSLQNRNASAPKKIRPSGIPTPTPILVPRDDVPPFSLSVLGVAVGTGVAAVDDMAPVLGADECEAMGMVDAVEDEEEELVVVLDGFP